MERNIQQKNYITSLFNVALPPRRKQVATKYITIRFVLQGTVPSIKNRQRAASNLENLIKKVRKLFGCKLIVDVDGALKYIEERYARWIYKPKEYVAWIDNTKPVILEQAAYWKERYEKHGLIYPLDNASMKVYHYWCAERGNPEKDLVNKLESLQDMLVQFGILSTDSYKNLNPVSSEAEHYGNDIKRSITLIEITQRF